MRVQKLGLLLVEFALMGLSHVQAVEEPTQPSEHELVEIANLLAAWQMLDQLSTAWDKAHADTAIFGNPWTGWVTPVIVKYYPSINHYFQLCSFAKAFCFLLLIRERPGNWVIETKNFLW